VVVSSYRVFILNDVHNRWLEQPPRLRLLRSGAIFLWRSHPSFAKEGYPPLPFTSAFALNSFTGFSLDV